MLNTTWIELWGKWRNTVRRPEITEGKGPPSQFSWSSPRLSMAAISLVSVWMWRWLVQRYSSLWAPEITSSRSSYYFSSHSAHRTDSGGSDLSSAQSCLTGRTHFYEYYHSRKGYFAVHSLIYSLVASISICCPVEVSINVKIDCARK